MAFAGCRVSQELAASLPFRCQAAEMVLLERQLEHSKRLHEYQIEEIKRNLFRLHKLINEKQLENDKLDE